MAVSEIYNIQLKQSSLYIKTITKFDGVALLIANHPPANSTTMHIRLVCQDINVCLDGTSYLPGPQTAVTFKPMMHFQIIQDSE